MAVKGGTVGEGMDDHDRASERRRRQQKICDSSQQVCSRCMTGGAREADGLPVKLNYTAYSPVGLKTIHVRAHIHMS